MDSSSYDDKAKISGTVEEIIYQNDENGYTICDIEDTDGYLVTLCGNMPFLNAGDSIDAVGKWVNHPTYGRQFSVEGFDKALPRSKDAILKYLASGTIRGIGPKTAFKIVEKFGEDTFDVLENHPDWLSDIPGITAKKAEEIAESFVSSSGSRGVMMFCSEYVGAANAMKIYKTWGNDAVSKVRSNPYVLCSSNMGISFQSVDNLAKSCGFSDDAPERIDASIIFALNHAASVEGHTCLPKDKLIANASEKIAVDPSLYEDRISALAHINSIIEVNSEQKFIYLSRYRLAEVFIAEKLKLIMKTCPKIGENDIDPFIKKAERISAITYASKQRTALAKAMDEGVLILTGGPGTGKTTIIKGLISIFESLNFKIALCAPTGRAAKRMSEATSYEAKTVHRLLEMERSGELGEARFGRNEGYYLDENVIIVDEFSMVDVLLFEALLKAIKPGTRLIIIGDKDQLPSVGAGNLLSDMLDSDFLPRVELTEIFRQSEDSNIIVNAHRINKGEMPFIDNKSKDFFFLSRENDTDIAKTLEDLIKNRLPKAYGNNVREKIQIITPSRKGEAGTVSLNTLLQSSLNPYNMQKPETTSHGNIFRVGDKVMQNKNDYDIEWCKDGIVGYGIFNGDTGIILDIDKDSNIITIDFDSRIAEYEVQMLEELELAYAITVHKSQGTEYPIVIIPIFNCAPMLQTRNLLYTAVTRAEKMVILVGRKSILNQMVSNKRLINRYSEFKTLLI